MAKLRNREDFNAYSVILRVSERKRSNGRGLMGHEGLFFTILWTILIFRKGVIGKTLSPRLNSGRINKGKHMNTSQLTTKTLSAAALAVAMVSTPALAQTALTSDAARQLVEPFYSMLTQPGTKDVRAIAEKFLAPEWKSYSDDTNFKGREAFINQVMGFGKLIPDLKWEIREVIVAGDRVVVRSNYSGTPQGPMFGMPTNGKSFQAMAIDIHTLQNGKSVTVYHIEDWASALRQLSVK